MKELCVDVSRVRQNDATDAPEAGKFMWRASSTWKNGTHCYSQCEKFNAFGEDHPHRQEYGIDSVSM